MTVITDEKRGQVLDRIADLGVTAEIAQELESMEYFYYEDISEIYPNTADLLEDQSNLLDVYQEAKQQAEHDNDTMYIVSTGSVYYHDYWQSVTVSELEDVALEWLEGTPTEDLEKALKDYE